MYDLENILVLDIETVPAHGSYTELTEPWKALWDKKAAQLSKEKSPEEMYERAGIYAEFGKIICIGIGVFYYLNDQLVLRVKSFENRNEKDLLMEFAAFLNTYYKKDSQLLAAHNGKEFDFPYLCRRLLINQIPIPSILQLSGKKPWEVKHLDTMELWKNGDYKSYTSLALLAACFGIESPKDDIDGSQVGAVYYQENDLERIANYCKKDVVTTAKVLTKMLMTAAIGNIEMQ